MTTTTVRVSVRTRERLAAIAREDFGGISQEAALNRLIAEHEMRQVHTAYARLRDDPVAWAEYQRELAVTDASSGDGVGDARDEYPEYSA